MWLNVGLISVNREAFETIIATVPDFQPHYQNFLADWQGEDTPWYLAMGELAHYVVECYDRGDTSRYQQLFSEVERVLRNGDSEVQNLIWVGLLEDIQNIASHRSFGPDVFREWLGPQSLIAWDEIDRGMQEVAEWVSQNPRPGATASTDAITALPEVKDSKLRRIIEQMYRKL